MKQDSPSTTKPHRSRRSRRCERADGWLTRQGVAQRLGISLTTVRRREGTILHPKTDPNGTHYFDPKEIDRVAVREKHASANGEITAHILQLLRDGHSLIDVIIETRQPERLVRRLHRLYRSSDADALVIPSEQRRELERIVGRRLTAPDLVRIVARLRSRSGG